MISGLISEQEGLSNEDGIYWWDKVLPNKVKQKFIDSLSKDKNYEIKVNSKFNDLTPELKQKLKVWLVTPGKDMIAKKGISFIGKGKRHSQGGIPVEVEEGEMIINRNSGKIKNHIKCEGTGEGIGSALNELGGGVKWSNEGFCKTYKRGNKMKKGDSMKFDDWKKNKDSSYFKKAEREFIGKWITQGDTKEEGLRLGDDAIQFKISSIRQGNVGPEIILEGFDEDGNDYKYTFDEDEVKRFFSGASILKDLQGKKWIITEYNEIKEGDYVTFQRPKGTHYYGKVLDVYKNNDTAKVEYEFSGEYIKEDIDLSILEKMEKGGSIERTYLYREIEKEIDSSYPTDAKKILDIINKSFKDGSIGTTQRSELYNYWTNKFGEKLVDSIKNEKSHERYIADYEFQSAKRKLEDLEKMKKGGNIKSTESFNDFKKELIDLIIKDSEGEFTKENIIIHDYQIEDFYNQGKSVEDVYFKEWEKDAGNYFAFEKGGISKSNKGKTKMEQGAINRNLDRLILTSYKGKNSLKIINKLQNFYDYFFDFYSTEPNEDGIYHTGTYLIGLDDTMHVSKGDYINKLEKLAKDENVEVELNIIKDKELKNIKGLEDVFPEPENELKYGAKISKSNKKEKGSKIKSHLMKSSKIKNEIKSSNYEQGGYAGKTIKQIWDNWSVKQRIHFLEDHNLDELYSSDSYKELTERAKTEIKRHVRKGQYEEGGKISVRTINEILDYIVVDFHTKEEAIKKYYDIKPGVIDLILESDLQGKNSSDIKSIINTKDLPFDSYIKVNEPKEFAIISALEGENFSKYKFICYGDILIFESDEEIIKFMEKFGIHHTIFEHYEDLEQWINQILPQRIKDKMK